MRKQFAYTLEEGGRWFQVKNRRHIPKNWHTIRLRNGRIFWKTQDLVSRMVFIDERENQKAYEELKKALEIGYQPITDLRGVDDFPPMRFTAGIVPEGLEELDRALRSGFEPFPCGAPLRIESLERTLRYLGEPRDWDKIRKARIDRRRRRQFQKHTRWPKR